MNTTTSIVIPSYNEAANLPKIFEKIAQLTKIAPNIKFIIVDNGSTDNTQKILGDLLKNSNGTVSIVHVPVNLGYGYGILQGLKAAESPFLGWTHGDLQTELSDIIPGIKILVESTSPTIVKGKRKNRNILDVVFTWGMQVIASILLKVRLNDINAQPKIFTQEFFKKHLMNNAPHDFSLDLFTLYQAIKNNYQVKDFPVYFHKRQFGEAKGGGSFKTKIKLIKRTSTYIWALHKKIAPC